MHLWKALLFASDGVASSAQDGQSERKEECEEEEDQNNLELLHMSWSPLGQTETM